MRTRVLVFAVAAAMALSVVAPASATPGSRTFTVQSTVAATGCGTTGTACGANCCVSYWNFTGRANLAPGLGSFRVTGLYDTGGAPFQDPPIGLRDLVLTLTAGNGDQLVLAEHVTWVLTDPPPPPTWTVDPTGSSGKFAGFSGSGTYSIAIGASSDGTSATFDIDLVGTLNSGP